MEVAFDVFRWATSTLEGVALIEYIILIILLLQWRRMEKHEVASRARHREIDENFARGRTRFAVIEERLDHVKEAVEKDK